MFKERTRLAAARERLRERVAAHGRTETVAFDVAAGRVLAESVTADRPVPHYARAAMDGYAVRAADTFDAGDRSPAVLRLTDDAVEPGTAVQVNTGEELPPGADAVVMVEHTDAVGGELDVFDSVAGGENVTPAGEDVEAGQRLFDAGHRLRPSDLGLLKSVERREVTVAERPRVAVLPTGEELVDADPDPGEVVETNGLTVAEVVETWGGDATYRDVVTDEETALREAIERDTDHDVVVTTGGSSVGERDLVPAVVDDLGEVLVHGVALQPGHPVGAGVVDGTPVLMLPGYPVSCLVTAVQLLRPVLKRAGGMPLPAFPTIEARLDGKVRSEPGVRTFARVALDDGPGDGEGDDGDEGGEGDSDSPERVASVVRASGAGVLSSVAAADGWVEVPESREGIPAGETVAVQDWEWSQ